MWHSPTTTTPCISPACSSYYYSFAPTTLIVGQFYNVGAPQREKGLSLALSDCRSAPDTRDTRANILAQGDDGP